MPKFELTVEIARPPADVFAYLTDVSKLPEWQSSAISASADSPMQAGSRIRERRKFLGRDVQSELEVTRYEPPQRFEAKSRVGPAQLQIRHALEPADSGTRLHVELDVKIGTMMRIAAQGPLRIAERELQADFARLKEILEANARGT